METINTPYDDTFRTLLQDCPELVVPLINELFGTNYTGREVVVSNENEIFLRNPEGKKEKRVTDSNLTLISLKGISKRYHLECQSTADGTMEIRMWEYDAQIALRNKEYRDGVLYVKFPDSAVIYLRSNSNTPDELKICICVGKKEIFYEIPICITKISTFLILCDLAVCLATLYVSFSLVFALMRYLQGKVFLIRFYSPTTLSSSRAEFRLPSRLACA